MAGRVKVLDRALADQIAAGEVVERPSSVVRELLDNARDAGATTITVEVRDGGVALIRVTDDGHGMEREDARLSVQRHATSKIRTQRDLEAIGTLGFRGEALPSIASVSKFSLQTRVDGDPEGTRVEVAGGADAVVSPAGCPVGTTIEVATLFYNVPARLKFLKAKATESAHITEVCTRAALAQPNLRLTLIRDGRVAREFLPEPDWAARAQTVAKPTALLRMEGERSGISVRAMLGAPEHARSGAGGLHIFVNGRPIRDRAMARSVAYAYGSVMPPGRYPVGVVQIETDPADVDVNVHPQKAEVRFRNTRQALDAVTRVLAQGLGTAAWSGPANRGGTTASTAQHWERRFPLGPVGQPDDRTAAYAGDRAAEAPADPWGLAPAPEGSEAPLRGRSEPATQPQEAGALPHTQRSRYTAVAQVRRLFIVAEGPDGLTILDQHAADERAKYHSLRTQLDERGISTQRLLLPERVDISVEDAALIEERSEDFARAGLEVSLLGRSTAAVHTVPALLRRPDPRRLLLDLLGELSRAGARNFGDTLDMALATMACHGAIRAGDDLSLAECQAVLDTMENIGSFAGHCPHGRPVLTQLPWDELERKVGR